jgi:hypothetical protein
VDDSALQGCRAVPRQTASVSYCHGETMWRRLDVHPRADGRLFEQQTDALEVACGVGLIHRALHQDSQPHLRTLNIPARCGACIRALDDPRCGGGYVFSS